MLEGSLLPLKKCPPKNMNLRSLNAALPEVLSSLATDEEQVEHLSPHLWSLTMLGHCWPRALCLPICLLGLLGKRKNMRVKTRLVLVPCDLRLQLTPSLADSNSILLLLKIFMIRIYCCGCGGTPDSAEGLLIALCSGDQRWNQIFYTQCARHTSCAHQILDQNLSSPRTTNF